ncbi:hypothetical protein TNCV_4497131 [Trichonephila clavipes]|nr:hypothetical protein TNCV_4497131 [Trichonephila clavipes]
MFNEVYLTFCYGSNRIVWNLWAVLFLSSPGATEEQLAGNLKNFRKKTSRRNGLFAINPFNFTALFSSHNTNNNKRILRE